MPLHQWIAAKIEDRLKGIAKYACSEPGRQGGDQAVLTFRAILVFINQQAIVGRWQYIIERSGAEDAYRCCPNSSVIELRRKVDRIFRPLRIGSDDSKGPSVNGSEPITSTCYTSAR